MKKIELSTVLIAFIALVLSPLCAATECSVIDKLFDAKDKTAQAEFLATLSMKEKREKKQLEMRQEKLLMEILRNKSQNAKSDLVEVKEQPALRIMRDTTDDTQARYYKAVADHISFISADYSKLMHEKKFSGRGVVLVKTGNKLPVGEVQGSPKIETSFGSQEMDCAVINIVKRAHVWSVPIPELLRTETPRAIELVFPMEFELKND